ncbi:MAG: dihydroorotate dehydrogenase [Deltaproteobacteria bacterium]|nr:dihydroorotate dehydrogenase [Deltaproteobacteria bacterium]
MTAVDMAVTMGALALKNPVMTASGTFGYAAEFADVCDVGALGGVVTKGISLQPRAGNPVPRICETAAGMLNSIGLANVGLEAFAADKMPYLRSCGAAVVVNFFGETESEYVECAARLSEIPGVAALEMNISCPNVHKGGIEFGRDPQAAGRLVRECVAAARVPVWVKLTPNVTDVVALAGACLESGAGGLSLINTLRGMAIDARTRRPRLATKFGGLSGPAIKPVALRMVFEVHRAFPDAPISAIGGLQSGEDAAEFMLAGATTLQVGTQNFVEPDAAVRVLRELRDFCAAGGVTRVLDLRGALQA